MRLVLCVVVVGEGYAGFFLVGAYRVKRTFDAAIYHTVRAIAGFGGVVAQGVIIDVLRKCLLGEARQERRRECKNGTASRRGWKHGRLRPALYCA